MTALLPSVRLKELLGGWIQKIFCVHAFLGVSHDRYDVISIDDGSKKGDVSLLIIRCSKCGAEKVIPTDRTYLSPNDANEPSRND